jgi:MarR family transcriptional regulator, temperature-dependent positive regulator of motility
LFRKCGDHGQCSRLQSPALSQTSAIPDACQSTAFLISMATSTDTTASAISLDLYDQPGHLIRRAHQISVSMFHELLGREVTPVQYSVLRMLHELPGLDQVTLAQRVGLDTSTTADIAVRLEAKGWIVREVLPRRQRRLLLTPEGEKLLVQFTPAVNALSHGLLDGMGEEDAQQLLRLLRKFVHLNNDQSRAPLRSSTDDTASG